MEIFFDEISNILMRLGNLKEFDWISWWSHDF